MLVWFLTQNAQNFKWWPETKYEPICRKNCFTRQQSARLRRAGGLGGITRRPHSSTGGRGPSHVGGNVTGMWWPAGSTCGDTLTSSDLALHINYVYILVVNVAYYILTPAAHCVPVCLSHSVDLRCQGSIGQMADCWADGMPIITRVWQNLQLVLKTFTYTKPNN